MAAFYFTPTIDPTNGWDLKLSPDGRYLVHGRLQLYGVDLFPGGAPTETALPGSGNAFSAGFISNTSCYYGDFTAAEMRALAVPGWADSLVAASALGTYIQAWNGHWGTFDGAYTVDGSVWTPSEATPAGMGLAGNWVAYTVPGNLVVIEDIGQTTRRTVDAIPSGSIAAWRLFEGPDGAYLFYVANSALWINNPANVTILANLPGIPTTTEAVTGGFGALSWIGTALWVTTYAFDGAIYNALHRPVGSGTCIVLPNIAANNLSMQVGFQPTGWVIGGSNNGTLGVWADIPYATVPTSFLGSTGSGPTFASGGGSPGRGVIAANTPHTAPLIPPRPAPHVIAIKDWPTQQSLGLAWDRLGHHREQLEAQAGRLDTQDATITELRAQVADLLARLGTP